MIERLSVCWYSVTKCGYYQGRGDGARLFGSLLETMQDLGRWSTGKQLFETAIVPVSENAGEENLPVYLFDITGGGDDWLFVLWNQIPATQGSVASVPGRAAVGSAAVVANPLQAGTIPGFATYFYVIPSRSIVGGVRFQHRTYGHEPMRRYLGNFLRFQSRAVVRDQDDETQILGYTGRPGGPLVQALPRFRSDTMRQGGEREMLIHRARDIRKVVRRAVLHNGRRADVDLFQRLIRYLSNADAVTPNWLETSLHYELPIRLEPQQVLEMADAWDNDESSEDWEDLGFVLRNESTPHWLSKSTARIALDLDVDRTDIERVEPRALLRQLRRQRDMLTGVIQREVDPG